MSKVTSSIRYFHGDDLIVSLDGNDHKVNIYSFDVPTAGRAAAVAFAMLDLLDSGNFLPICTAMGAVNEIMSELEIVVAGHSLKRVVIEPESVANENTEGNEAPEVPF